MRGLFLFSPSALDYGQRLLFMTPAQIWRHERKSRVNQFAKADTLDCDHQSQNVLGIGPLKTPYPIALIITSAYGTVVPSIGKWSSVMKLTPQRLHLKTLTSIRSTTPRLRMFFSVWHPLHDYTLGRVTIK
jgi:hypothetical protein